MLVVLTYTPMSRARVAPLLARAESALQDLGCRTRLPPNRGRNGLTAAQRRRLRETVYADIERADYVLHVPIDDGPLMSLELGRACRCTCQVLLLESSADRDLLGVPAVSPSRLETLCEETQGHVLAELAELESVLPSSKRWTRITRVHPPRPLQLVWSDGETSED